MHPSGSTARHAGWASWTPQPASSSLFHYPFTYAPSSVRIKVLLPCRQVWCLSTSLSVVPTGIPLPTFPITRTTPPLVTPVCARHTSARHTSARHTSAFPPFFPTSHTTPLLMIPARASPFLPQFTHHTFCDSWLCSRRLLLLPSPTQTRHPLPLRRRRHPRPAQPRRTRLAWMR